MQNYLFDFDGTIVDSRQAVLKSTRTMCQKIGLPVPTDDVILNYMGIPLEAMVPDMVTKAGKTFSPADYNHAYATFRKAYRANEFELTTVFPHMKETLAQLQQQGHRLFIVTSKNSHSLALGLEKFGLTQYFTGTVGSDNVAHFKPAPDGVLAVLDEYHLKADESVMIGDAKYDLQMGNAAGVHTCGCTWAAFSVANLKREHPDYLIDNPEELLTLD